MKHKYELLLSFIQKTSSRSDWLSVKRARSPEQSAQVPKRVEDDEEDDPDLREEEQTHSLQTDTWRHLTTISFTLN